MTMLSTQTRRFFHSGCRCIMFVALAATTFVFGTSEAAKADKVLVYSSNTYGYAGADFDWSGRGRLSNINLAVSDWKCDSNPVWAYFRVNRTNNQYFTTKDRYDYSGCDLSDHTDYNGLSISDGYDIKSVQLYLCVRNGPCHLGAESSPNPFLEQ